ncbi:MAG: hypothetical protein GXO09_00440 [Crenarchaeota archaeon]|nr:hypothetical protein [Thermoproteota archaeon]
MKQCIRCGKEVDKLVDGRLCPSCFLEVYGLGRLPRVVEITMCPRCGAVHYAGSWVDMGGLEDAIRAQLMASFKPHPEVESFSIESVEYVRDRFHGDYALVRVTGRLRGLEGDYSSVHMVRVRVVKKLCPSCFRRAAGSFAALLQVRSTRGRLTPQEEEMVMRVLSSAGKPASSIISVERVREGLDIKLDDAAAARMLAARLRSLLAAETKQSYKLVGRRSDGKRLGRVTVSARLPFFHEGSMVSLPDGRLAVVERIRGGRVYVRLLGMERRMRMSVEEAWHRLKPPAPQESHRVLVAASTPTEVHVQLIDREYEYQEIPRGYLLIEGGEPRPGEERLLLRSGGKYYLLPAEGSGGE